jgi:hypothetical protein
MGDMNEHEISESVERYWTHPVLGPATRTLYNLCQWTNRNSDGWPYWAKPRRAAGRLETLIRRDGTSRYLYDDRDDATVDELKAALRPVKAFRTRHQADFEIVESLDDVEVFRTYHFRFEIEAATAEEANEKLEELIAQEGLGAALNLTVVESERVKA